MKVCVVAPDYPTSKTFDFVFVDQLCRGMAANGEDVTVIAPQTLTKCLIRHIPIARRKSIINISNGCNLTLLRPKYFSFGSLQGPLRSLTKNGYENAVKRAFKNLRQKPDAIYGHFWQSVKAAYPLAKKYNIPLYASSGEEQVYQERIGYTDEDIKTISRYISGVINVSSNNKDQCLATGLVTGDKCCVIPNAIDETLFYRRDKKLCRNLLGVKDSDFLVAFVGQWVSRKGILKLNDALKQIGNPEIKAFFLGKGPEVPDYEGIIFKGIVSHSNLPEYLSAADVFVLPTQNEGCSNAIIEALACGVPVISSDLPFNYDVLDDSNSILIDPNDVEQIKESILHLRNSPALCETLSLGALETAESLTLSKRVERIINFINSRRP